MNAMFRRSATSGSGSDRRVTTVLADGSDSPVSAASFTRRVCASVSRRSASTTSPTASSTRSPGTSWAARSCLGSPSRTTVAVGLVIRRRADIARFAWNSCTKPTIAFRISTAVIAIASTGSPMKAVTIAATSRSTIMPLENCRANIRHIETRGPSASSFGPTLARRRSASSLDNPWRMSVASSRARSSTSTAQGRSSASDGSGSRFDHPGLLSKLEPTIRYSRLPRVVRTTHGIEGRTAAKAPAGLRIARRTDTDVHAAPREDAHLAHPSGRGVLARVGHGTLKRRCQERHPMPRHLDARPQESWRLREPDPVPRRRLCPCGRAVRVPVRARRSARDRDPRGRRDGAVHRRAVRPAGGISALRRGARR